MKKVLNNPLYLAVTATPQANIFLDEYSAVKPDDIMLIDPAVGYCGANIYHQTSELIDIVNDDISDISNGMSMPTSLRNAINYFIIASAIKMNITIDKKANYSDMIVHSHRTTKHHKILYNMINSYIEDLKNCILYDSNDLGGRLNIFKQCYREYFYEKYNTTYNFDNLKENILMVIKQIEPILKNSKGGNSQTIENLTYHKIYIKPLGNLFYRVNLLEFQLSFFLYSNAPNWAKAQVEKYISIIKNTEHLRGQDLMQYILEWNLSNPNYKTSYSCLMLALITFTILEAFLFSSLNQFNSPNSTSISAL